MSALASTIRCSPCTAGKVEFETKANGRAYVAVVAASSSGIKAGAKTRPPPGASPADGLEEKPLRHRRRAKLSLEKSGRPARPCKGKWGAASPSSLRGAVRAGPFGPEPSMFPDIARDDVFRLETKRLWLRWPRVADAKAIERYSSRWEVAKMTARIPHPYPPGEAERFIFTAREANALGRDLILVDRAHPRQARADRHDQPGKPPAGPPDPRLCACAGSLGQGPGDRSGRWRRSRRASR